MVNEIFTIKKEKKAVDKLTYQLLSITDKQDNINKNMVFCTFFKRLSWKKEEAKYAEKTDKNNTLTFWVLSVEASKISYAMNQFIDKKIFSANELRETFDYLKWIKTSIKSMKSEWWTVENEEDWSSYVTKDKIVITISLFRCQNIKTPPAANVRFPIAICGWEVFLWLSCIYSVSIISLFRLQDFDGVLYMEMQNILKVMKFKA